MEVVGQQQAGVVLAEQEPGFLGCFAARCLQGVFAGVGVPAGQLPGPASVHGAQLHGSVVLVAQVETAVHRVVRKRLYVRLGDMGMACPASAGRWSNSIAIGPSASFCGG